MAASKLESKHGPGTIGDPAITGRRMTADPLSIHNVNQPRSQRLTRKRWLLRLARMMKISGPLIHHPPTLASTGLCFSDHEVSCEGEKDIGYARSRTRVKFTPPALNQENSWEN